MKLVEICLDPGGGFSRSLLGLNQAINCNAEIRQGHRQEMPGLPHQSSQERRCGSSAQGTGEEVRGKRSQAAIGIGLRTLTARRK